MWGWWADVARGKPENIRGGGVGRMWEIGKKEKRKS